MLGAVLTLAFAGPAAAKDDVGLKLLPAGAAGVVHVDLERMRGSVVFQELYKLLSANPAFQQGKAKLKADLGLDIDRDLHGATLVIDGKTGQPVVIINGKFDQKKIAAIAKKEGKAKRVKHKGVGYWLGKDKQGIAFVGGRLVVGRASQVKAVIDAHKGKRLKAKGKAMQLIKKTDQGKDVWAVIHMTKKFRKNMKGQDAERVRTVRAHLDLAKGLALRVVAVTEDAAVAKKIVAGVKKNLGQAKANPGFMAMGIAQLIGKVKAKAKAKGIHLSVNWDQQDIAKAKMFLTMASAMMQARGAPPAGGAPGAPGAPAGKGLIAAPPPAK